MRKVFYQFISKFIGEEPKSKQSDLDIPIKTRVVYPIEGYEKLTETQKFNLFGECVKENGLFLQK